MSEHKPLSFILSDLGWIIPSSLALGGLLALASPGSWLIGWLSFSLILVAGLLVVTTFWRRAGRGRGLAGIIAVAFLARLIAGVALTLLLPVAGYDSETQRGGYVFYDAYRRDQQAWQLASSGEPLWRAFDKSYSTDQYGGLLALSALVYRFLSPDAQRPLLIILLGALVAAAGIPILWRIGRQMVGEQLARPACWILALYPEGVLQGASQMREPFLITFVVFTIWGFIESQLLQFRRGWGWLAAGFAGLLLFSPGVALLMLVVLAGWGWFSREHQRGSWQIFIGAVAVFTVALALFIWGATRQVDLGGLNLQRAADWFSEVSHWDTLEMERQSGWLQKLFDEMDSRWRIPFITVYGITQPVLPAALIEQPALPLWRVVGVLRAVGWYTLVPFLLYGFLAAAGTRESSSRRVWLWIAAVVWAWIVLSAIRAGGDQWDNPRYRVMLLGLQALLAGYAWAWWRAHPGPGLMRIVVIEVIFLCFFTEWYLNRYYGILFKMPFFGMVLAILVTSALFLAISLGLERLRRSLTGRP